ncbi:MAG: PAS domain-containing protein [Allorhizobium sp.]
MPMPQTLREENLQSRFNAVSMKILQLQQAIRVGDDDLVRLLDRELDPLIGDVVDYWAVDSREIHLQLRFIGSLIREDAGDRSCVVRHSAVLSVLLDRYFGTDRLTVGDGPVLFRQETQHLRGGVDDTLLNESILNSLHDRIAVITADCRYIYVNPTYAAYRNRTALDLVGHHVSEFIGQENFETRTKTCFDRCFAGETVDFTYWASGGVHPLLVRGRATPLRAHDNRVIGAIMMLKDAVQTIDDIAA